MSVTVALTKDKKYVHIREAQQTIPYDCISCGLEVLPVQGKMLTWHFRHRKDSTCPGKYASVFVYKFNQYIGLSEHSNESEVHMFAKLYIHETLSKWSFRCHSCTKSFTFGLDFVSQIEYKIDSYKIDIGVLNSKCELKHAIEVWFTHLTTNEKRKHLYDKLQTDLIEIEALDVT